ncbi:MAG: DUF6036 family nucleotidyltransferase [Anaeromyxobacter sp.]
MARRSYGYEALAGFLRVLDAELTRPTRITVIGGAAIGLLYDTRHATTDIDLTPGQGEAFWAAVDRARLRAHEPVPIETAGIFQPPYSYEDRCLHLELSGLRQLQVFVPERHDLALMKIARGYAHDLQGIADVHAVQALDLDTLVARYHESRTQVIGSAEMFKLSFLAAVETLFGEATASTVAQRLEVPPPPMSGV